MRRHSAQDLLPLRVACGIGIADSAVALATAVLTRPHVVSLVGGAAWLALWMLAFLHAERLAAAVAARPWALVPVGAAAMAPAVFDGGWPGTLATQPMWIAIVAAAAAPVAVAVVTGIALTAAKGAAFAAAGTPLADLFPASGPTALTTDVLAPLALALLALALVATLRRMVDAVGQAFAAAAPAVRLSPAERAVVDLLAQGLTPKEIAQRRGTSLATVRTQIKRAKRAAGARTLDELIATAWRPT